MKTRFSTIDIRATIGEIQENYLGMRVTNVYDIDNKTYLIKLAKPDHKATLLLESGVRLHSTEFEWPKNITPSGFSMKLRKHLRSRRLEKVEQLGVDRIIDLQFGSGEAAYHIILEMYDRGNIVLTDYNYMILNILRPRTDHSQDVKLVVREKYPVDAAKQPEGPPTEESLRSILMAGKEGDHLKKLLNPKLIYGAAVIEECLIEAGLSANAKLGIDFSLDADLPQLVSSLKGAENLLNAVARTRKGYILQKAEKKAVGEEELLTYTEFHPHLYRQHVKEPHLEFDSFCKAVDEFFSKMESQKLDMKAVQQEKQAVKKLENVKKDHAMRLRSLHQEQEADVGKANLIEVNLELVDRAIVIVKSALANQIDWTEIWQIVKEAQARGDPVARAITGLCLDANRMTMLLYEYSDNDDSSDKESDEDNGESGSQKKNRQGDHKHKPVKVDIDLGLSAFANARRFYDHRRNAAVKEHKTLESSERALRNAERKTKQTLKEMAAAVTINKARKTYWFEKFLWFISSENFLVIGGRDSQQNEFIVKRHLRPGDVYVHADLHGASSVIIKNPSGEPVPPKTLNEAGTMAVCNSAAWEAKVYTSAWWVHHHQVSKTAPTGEYLTTGSFMIRGKKNFLPPCYLVYGFGFLFKLDEDSVFRHKDERRIRGLEEDAFSMTTESDTTEATADMDIALEDENKSDDGDKSGESSDEESNVATEDQERGEVEGTEQDTTHRDNHEEEDSEEEEPQFPDTSIQLQHVKDDKFTLQRSVSVVSQASSDSNVIELGDGIALNLNTEKPVKSGSKLSAKQRRDLRKARRKGTEEVADSTLEKTEDRTEEPSSFVKEVEETKEEKDQQQKQPKEKHPEVQQPKRGQKKKLKKIREKYADQDEEDRQLAMELLASAGPQKDKGKDKKKNKKGSSGRPHSSGMSKQQDKGAGQSARPQSGLPRRKLTVEDLKVETLTLDEKTASHDANSAKPTVKQEGMKEEEAPSDEEEEETARRAEDSSVIDSLTGIPIPEEDGLLFATPVCAPYTALVNYKFKVKLTPGTARRGKAVKTALHMFMHDKAISAREKELLRTVKDSDLSRNVPGKVKISAPNLHKQKKK